MEEEGSGKESLSRWDETMTVEKEEEGRERDTRSSLTSDFAKREKSHRINERLRIPSTFSHGAVPYDRTDRQRNEIHGSVHKLFYREGSIGCVSVYVRSHTRVIAYGIRWILAEFQAPFHEIGDEQPFPFLIPSSNRRAYTKDHLEVSKKLT